MTLHPMIYPVILHPIILHPIILHPNILHSMITNPLSLSTNYASQHLQPQLATTTTTQATVCTNLRTTIVYIIHLMTCYSRPHSLPSCSHGLKPRLSYLAAFAHHRRFFVSWTHSLNVVPQCNARLQNEL